jgi:hypothetical protein
MTRNGKTARLPRGIRIQLNRRLQDGEPVIRLVEWLNSSPEVRQVLAEDFGGREISEQNLSEWKQGGHEDWLARQETLACARELAGDAGELAEAADGSQANHLAVVLSARDAALVSGWNGEMDDEFRRKARALRTLCRTSLSCGAAIIARNGCGSTWTGLRRPTRRTSFRRWRLCWRKPSNGRTCGRHFKMPSRC